MKQFWRALRFEALSLPAGSFQTLVVERIVEASGRAGVSTIWIDVATRLWVKLEWRRTIGPSAAPIAWHATRLTMPPSR